MSNQQDDAEVTSLIEKHQRLLDSTKELQVRRRSREGCREGVRGGLTKTTPQAW